MIHTAHDGLPTVAAIEPIEKSTRAGTPLATQKAPAQPILRWSVALAPPLPMPLTASTVVVFICVLLKVEKPHRESDMAALSAPLLRRTIRLWE